MCESNFFGLKATLFLSRNRGSKVTSHMRFEDQKIGNHRRIQGCRGAWGRSYGSHLLCRHVREITVLELKCFSTLNLIFGGNLLDTVGMGSYKLWTNPKTKYLICTHNSMGHELLNFKRARESSTWLAYVYYGSWKYLLTWEPPEFFSFHRLSRGPIRACYPSGPRDPR